MRYLFVSFLISLTHIAFSQPSLEFVTINSEGGPSIHGQSSAQIALTSDGGYFQTGNYDLSISLAGLGGYNNASVGDNSYVSKYDAEGNGVWAFKLETSDDDIRIYQTQSDSEDNVIICGRLDGRVDFDPGPGEAYVGTPNNPKGFIAKYDKDGNYLWHRSFGSSAWHVWAETMAVDDEDNIYIGGDTGNQLSIGGTTISTSAGTIYIAKYNANGGFEWIETYGDAKFYSGEKISVAGNRITLATRKSSTFNSPENVYVVQARTDNGEFIGANFISLPNDQRPVKVQSFDNGKYTLLYYTYIDDTFRSSGIYSNANENHNYTVDPELYTINSFDVAAFDVMYVTLSGKRTLTYDPASVGYDFSGDPNAYLVKIAPDGEEIWKHSWTSEMGQRGGPLRVTEQNEIFLSGVFYGPGGFDLATDEVTHTPSSQVDGFVLKWKDCGVELSDEGLSGCGSIFWEGEEYNETGIFTIYQADSDGCLSIHSIQFDVFHVDSLITIDDVGIYSHQSSDNAFFTWYDVTADEMLDTEDNYLIPDGPGKYRFEFTTTSGCMFESDILTFPENKLKRFNSFQRFGKHVHLIDGRILANAVESNQNSLYEFYYILDTIQVTANKLSYPNEIVGEKVIPYEDGLIVNSDKDYLRYYTRGSDFKLELDQQINPVTSLLEHVGGFGASIAIDNNYLFVGAPTSSYPANYSNNGVVEIYIKTTNGWIWTGSMESPNIADDGLFGTDVYVHNDKLIITEPGYENTNGKGLLHIYDLTEWSGGNATPNFISSYSDELINPGIYAWDNELYYSSNDQVFKFDLDDIQNSKMALLEEGRFGNIRKLKGHEDRLCFSTESEKYPGSYQVHLFQSNGAGLDYDLTFYPYSSNSQFGIDYDLNHEEIAIGAPTYFDGVSTSNLGKVARYAYAGLSTSVVELPNSLEDIIISPNPTTDFININYNHMALGHLQFVITDIAGNKILQTANQNISVAHIDSGIYFVTIMDKNNIIASSKFVKQ